MPAEGPRGPASPVFLVMNEPIQLIWRPSQKAVHLFPSSEDRSLVLDIHRNRPFQVYLPPVRNHHRQLRVPRLDGFWDPERLGKAQPLPRARALQDNFEPNDRYHPSVGPLRLLLRWLRNGHHLIKMELFVPPSIDLKRPLNGQPHLTDDPRFAEFRRHSLPVHQKGSHKMPA